MSAYGYRQVHMDASGYTPVNMFTRIHTGISVHKFLIGSQLRCIIQNLQYKVHNWISR